MNGLPCILLPSADWYVPEVPFHSGSALIFPGQAHHSLPVCLLQIWPGSLLPLHDLQSDAWSHECICEPHFPDLQQSKNPLPPVLPDILRHAVHVLPVPQFLLPLLPRLVQPVLREMLLAHSHAQSHRSHASHPSYSAQQPLGSQVP